MIADHALILDKAVALEAIAEACDADSARRRLDGGRRSALRVQTLQYGWIIYPASTLYDDWKLFIANLRRWWP